LVNSQPTHVFEGSSLSAITLAIRLISLYV
jgi:hypothetical protein